MTDETTSTQPARPVDAIADADVEDYSALDPVAATYLGVSGCERRLTDQSPEGYAARSSLRPARHDGTPSGRTRRRVVPWRPPWSGALDPLRVALARTS